MLNKKIDGYIYSQCQREKQLLKRKREKKDEFEFIRIRLE
jgi:hypothetical protein